MKQTIKTKALAFLKENPSDFYSIREIATAINVKKFTKGMD